MSATSERRAAIAAYDAMVKSRPLTPPSKIRHVDTRTTGARELAREVRRGYYDPNRSVQS